MMIMMGKAMIAMTTVIGCDDGEINNEFPTKTR